MRENHGTIPDAQLIEKVGLALAIFRRGRTQTPAIPAVAPVSSAPTREISGT